MLVERSDKVLGLRLERLADPGGLVEQLLADVADVLLGAGPDVVDAPRKLLAVGPDLAGDVADGVDPLALLGLDLARRASRSPGGRSRRACRSGRGPRRGARRPPASAFPRAARTGRRSRPSDGRTGCPGSCRRSRPPRARRGGRSWSAPTWPPRRLPAPRDRRQARTRARGQRLGRAWRFCDSAWGSGACARRIRLKVVSSLAFVEICVRTLTARRRPTRAVGNGDVEQAELDRRPAAVPDEAVRAPSADGSLADGPQRTARGTTPVEPDGVGPTR